MNVGTWLVAFAVALAAAFRLAFFVGSVAGVDVDPVDDHGHDPVELDGHGGHGEVGYALELDSRHVRAGRSGIRFRVVDADGAAVTAYTERHERDLHLIVVAADNLRDYQHVHPELASDGTWSASLRTAPGHGVPSA